MATNIKAADDDVQTDDENTPTYEVPDLYSDRPVLTPGKFGWDIVTATRAAYADGYSTTPVDNAPESRYLKFHSEWTTPAQAAVAAGHIDRYNHFDARNVAEVLFDLPEGAKVAVAREGSPAVYVWTDQGRTVAELFQDMPGAPDELGGEVEAEAFPGYTTGERVHNLEDGTPTLVRAWWD